jgi:hypothetical protein
VKGWREINRSARRMRASYTLATFFAGIICG